MDLAPHVSAAQIQYNEGKGGCFPFHFDTAETTGRHLTIVLYLNSAWKQGDGGELRVYPFPFESEDVAPLNDRMVLFCSRTQLHRILPSHASRLVVSLWFTGSEASK